MTEPDATNPNEALVRGYLTALDRGRILDALNAFSLDARLQDETGRERRGIREIAAAFARRELPAKVDIEDLEREGDTVTARVRLDFPGERGSRSYRSVFWVRRDRIGALVMEPLPRKRTAHSGTRGSA